MEEVEEADFGDEGDDGVDEEVVGEDCEERGRFLRGGVLVGRKWDVVGVCLGLL